MDKPKVAVVMSVHIGAPLHFLRDAIGSMLRQTYPNVLTYVMCDGPQRPEVSTYLRTLPLDRVRLLHSRENRGLAVAMNRLLDLVTETGGYEFVARMDADDISEPERIEKQVAFMLAHPDVGITGTWCAEINEHGERLFVKRLPTDHDDMLKLMNIRSPLVHPSVVARLHVFAGGMRYAPDLRQAQDYDLWSRMVFQGVRMANLPEALIRYRVDSDFYKRRAGCARAWNEARTRYEHMTRFQMRSLKNLALLIGVVLMRMAPAWVKRLAYRKLR